MQPSGSQTGAAWPTKGGIFYSREDLGRKRCGWKNLKFWLLMCSTHKKTAQRGCISLKCLQYASKSCFIIIVWASSFRPLLGRSRSRGRCWAANRLSQAVKSMRRSMDWTLENNMVNCLFFCTTLTSWRSGHVPFVWAGAGTSETGAEVVELEPHCSWEGHSWRVGHSWEGHS